MSNRTWYQELWVRLCRWAANRLPRGVVYFATLRALDHAAPSRYLRDSISAADVIGLWGRSTEDVAEFWRPKR